MMTTDLIVVAPQGSFGELIRQSLQETGTFRVHVVKGKADAVLTAEQNQCKLALMDIDLGENILLEIGRILRQMNPDMDIIILADEDIPPTMDSIRPWILLRKPFYLPDFIKLIHTVPILPDQIHEQPDSLTNPDQFPKIKTPGSPELFWLEDVSKAAQHLTRLTLASSAQAALITRKSELWAYAGQLSQNAANELAYIVSRHWDNQKGSDLLRFVRLESTRAEHMLYATSMAPEIVLALVFDAETPFSTIRSQANDLAQSLKVANGQVQPAETQTRSLSAEKEQSQIQPDEEISTETNESVEIPSIAEIINEIPPPSPVEHTETSLPHLGADELKEKAVQQENDVSTTPTRPLMPLPDTNHISVESSPAIHLQDLALTEKPVEKQITKPDVDDELAVTMPSKSQPQQPSTPIRRPAPGELDETRPNTINELSGHMIVESASPAMTQLNFACLLIPRFTSHHMIGDLADSLSRWMPEICIAFGWRLEYLAVRPDYLQWVVNGNPNTSPGYLMRIMRKHTSEKIFNEFPRLKYENPSGDFWAPGYLIMGASQPHPPQLVKDYIRQTRQRQGISLSRQ